jgi:hypothetical protein
LLRVHDLEGLTRDKTRKPGKQPLPTGTVQRVVDLALGPHLAQQLVCNHLSSPEKCPPRCNCADSGEPFVPCCATSKSEGEFRFKRINVR